MRNGVELRKGGRVKIEKRGATYHVFFLEEDGSWTSSKNGPWDYLVNARWQADEEFEKRIHR